MRGSTYPDGVVVDHVALRRTEVTKAEEILRNRVDWTSRGIFTGGEITVNTSGSAPYLNIDVKQLSGYAPNGEYIETTSDYYNIALSDYTSGVVNRVCAVYTEDEDYYQPHESDNERYPTRAQAAWRIRVFTDAEFNALPATDDNLANDAQDRCLLIGKVTAQGATTSLTQSNIEGPTTFNNILYSTPSTLIQITGVTVLEVSPNTPVGDGSLEYDKPGAPHDFEWTTSNGTGPTVSITSDGIYNFTDGAGEYIRCLVTLSLLPTSGLPITETITVTNLYYQAVPRLTAADLLHRNLRGTGVVSPTNPHGLSVEDIAGESLPYLEQHQDVMHCNGIWKGSSSNIFQATINTGSTGGDTLNIQDPSSGDLFYINGKQFDSILNNQIYFDPGSWDANWGNSTSTGLLEVYVDDESNVFAKRKMSYPPGTRNVQGTWIVDCSKDYPAASGLILKYEVSGGNYIFTWDGGKPLSIASSDLISQVIRLYAKNGIDWIDLWVNGNDTPTAADDTLPSGAGPYQDNIDVLASPDRDQNMQIASLSLWYDSVSPKRKLGYAPYTGLRRTIDKRSWGTLCVENMADSALQEMIYSPNNEYLSSGIVFNRNGFANEFELYNIAALAADIRGGAYYCRGKRIETTGATSLGFADNATNLVYVDFEGNFDVLDVTNDFSGSVVSALKYVVGASALTPRVDDETHFSVASTGEEDQTDPPERGVALWLVDASGGAVTDTVDISKNINNVEVEWSVGNRRSSSILSTFAATFDSLESAFLYAELAQQYPHFAGSIEVILVAESNISRRIVQPTYVNVRGTAGHDASPEGSTVYINYGSADGAWALSERNVLENLCIHSQSGAGAALRVANGIEIRGCKYTHANPTQYFMTLDDSSWVGVSKIENVTIRNCEFILNRATIFANAISLANGYQNFQIAGNHFRSTDDVSVLRLEYCQAPIVSENRFLCSGGTGFVNPVFLKDTDYAKVFENHVELGDSTGDVEVGFEIRTVLNSVFKGNSIKRVDGSTSIDGTAFRVYNSDYCNIGENTVKDLGEGVIFPSNLGRYWVLNNNDLKVFKGGIIARVTDTTIDGNVIYSESVGILVKQDRSIVSNNAIRIVTERDNPYTSLGGLLGGYGIIGADNSAHLTIHSNEIFMQGRSSDNLLLDNSSCIALGSCSHFSIQSNKTYISCDGLVSGTGQHIIVRDYAKYDKGHFAIKDNVIDNHSATPTPVAIHGLYVSETGYGGGLIHGAAFIEGNLILDNNLSTGSYYALYVETSANANFKFYPVVRNNVMSVPNLSGQPKTQMGTKVITVGLTLAPTNIRMDDGGLATVF